jgi:hypothetical protein
MVVERGLIVVAIVSEQLPVRSEEGGQEDGADRGDDEWHSVEITL